MIPAAIFIGAFLFIIIAIGTCIGVTNHTNK